jgi:L-asparaginase
MDVAAASGQALSSRSATSTVRRETVGLGLEPRDLVCLVPELAQIATLETKTVFHLDSSDLVPADWVRLADEVHAALGSYDGVVIAHGTDTMAYAASLLAFLLGPVPKPVVLTGAQRPLSAVRNDARSNLIDAVLVATMKVPEVCIAFGSQVFRGVRATKLDAWEFDAFASPSHPPLVRLGIEMAMSPTIRSPSALLPFDPRCESRLLHLRVFPGLDPLLVQNALALGAKGVVLATYGSGTLPSGAASLLAAIEEAKAREVPVLIVSQCPRGHVDLGRYAGGARAAELGAISGHDMTVECALAKMMVALGRFSDFGARRQFLATPLLGEMSVDAAILGER